MNPRHLPKVSSFREILRKQSPTLRQPRMKGRVQKPKNQACLERQRTRCRMIRREPRRIKAANQRTSVSQEIPRKRWSPSSPHPGIRTNVDRRSSFESARASSVGSWRQAQDSSCDAGSRCFDNRSSRAVILSTQISESRPPRVAAPLTAITSGWHARASFRFS